MKKCFDITRLLCLSVLLSVFCFSSVLAAPAGEAPALRVALLLEDAAPDQGWNDLLRQGLEQARKELGVRTAVVVAPPQGSNGLTQEGIFRAAARQADLVLLSGARLHEILRNNAANFRQTKFGCIDTGIRAANIMCVTFADEQAAFLAGALLSQLHRHGLLPAPRTRAAGDELTLGWLAGEDDPQLKSMLNGFVEGVRLESPGARVINGVAGSYSSPEKGRAKAEELLGLDINALAVLAGRAGLGAVEAAIAQGRPLVGVDKDQQFLAPKLMLTSIVIDKVLIMGQKQTQVMVISPEYERINQAIHQKIDRGSTLIHATSGLEKQEQKVVLSVISNRQLGDLNELILQIDPQAFVIANEVNEVKGRGFTLSKLSK